MAFRKISGRPLQTNRKILLPGQVTQLVIHLINVIIIEADFEDEQSEANAFRDP